MAKLREVQKRGDDFEMKQTENADEGGDEPGIG
jgi:hypothetical protein